MSCNRKAEVRSTRSGRLRLTMRGPPEVRFVPIGDVTPVYSITPSTVASNLEGGFRPNVLAVLSRRFSLSVPYWLPWTFVHLQGVGKASLLLRSFSSPLRTSVIDFGWKRYGPRVDAGGNFRFRSESYL